MWMFWTSFESANSHWVVLLNKSYNGNVQFAEFVYRTHAVRAEGGQVRSVRQELEQSVAHLR